MKLGMLLAICLTLAPLAAQQAAQPAAQPAPPWTKGEITKVFDVKNREVNDLFALLSGFGATLKTSSALKAIAVTGPPSVVDAIGEAIKRFDVPAKNVELTLYLVSALARASSQEPLPKELDGVAKELRSVFTYQGYRLLDTMILRCREGGQETRVSSSYAPIPAQPGVAAPYSIRLDPVTVSEDGKTRTISTRQLNLSGQGPSIVTGISVREGQKIVVGKTGMGGSDALILVVTAKVVD
jgi:hypothetical protein